MRELKLRDKVVANQAEVAQTRKDKRDRAAKERNFKGDNILYRTPGMNAN